MSSSGEQASPEQERIPLSNDDPALRRKRQVSGAFGALLFAAAFGGIAGLIAGRVAGLAAAGVVGAGVFSIVAYNTRRRVWLEGGTLVVRTWGTRRIELAAAEQLFLLVTDVRSTRTLSLMAGARKGGKTVKIDLALYAGVGGRELGILPLRKLANALMNNVEANGMIFAELLVAQLRSEARGDGIEARPLHRLTAAAPGGKIAQRYPMEAISRFVASLD
ncbi:MAG: hypothetical protein ACRDQW_03605 [Haloechinothrix sp.]